MSGFKGQVSVFVIPAKAGIQFLFFIILFFAFSAFAQEAQPQEDSIQKVESYLNSITTVSADFLQIAPNGDESTGKFYMSRPGKMRWQYNPPMPILITISGPLLSYYDAELDQISNVPSASSLASFLARDKIKLSGDIKVLSSKNEDGLITIKLTQAKKPDEGSLTLIFSAEPMQLKKLITADASGKETQVTFSNMELGQSLDAKLFVMPNPRLNEKGRSRN